MQPPYDACDNYTPLNQAQLYEIYQSGSYIFWGMSKMGLFNENQWSILNAVIAKEERPAYGLKAVQYTMKLLYMVSS